MPMPPADRVAPFDPRAERWQVLDHLTVTAAARRQPDGSVVSRRSEGREPCILFGPHWWLGQGGYRLTFSARCAEPRWAAQPVLGVEIITQNRLHQIWRDFTAAELAGAAQSLTFAVSAEISLETGEESRFEFRFFELGNGPVTVGDVSLERHGPEMPTPSRWRLLGRLTAGVARTGDGGVAVGAPSLRRTLLSGGWPYLRLASGRYRLSLAGNAPADALVVEVLGRSHWRRLGQRLNTFLGRTGLAERVARQELAALPAQIEFSVPHGLSVDAGENAPFEIRLRRKPGRAVRIEAIELERLGPLDEIAAPAITGGKRISVVAVGNCQADMVCRGFQASETLNRRFAVKYHFVNLQANLQAAARRDLESCDIVLAQDIRDWEDYPLRAEIPGRVPVISFPLLNFASLWPFDHYNGPGDRYAHDSEWPNLTFTYLDGLLARLRKEIPDPEARFHAYATLDHPGIIDYRRMLDFETRRLETMDAKFGGGIGRHILSNFRRRPLFHTTNHPGGEVMALLLAQLVRRMELRPGRIAPAPLDRLDAIQVPVHPVVAADLDVRWATHETLYQFRGEMLTWEDYVRRYIAHYG